MTPLDQALGRLEDLPDVVRERLRRVRVAGPRTAGEWEAVLRKHAARIMEREGRGNE